MANLRETDKDDGARVWMQNDIEHAKALRSFGYPARCMEGCTCETALETYNETTDEAVIRYIEKHHGETIADDFVRQMKAPGDGS